jgi:hypothetical protein
MMNSLGVFVKDANIHEHPLKAISTFKQLTHMRQRAYPKILGNT